MMLCSQTMTLMCPDMSILDDAATLVDLGVTDGTRALLLVVCGVGTHGFLHGLHQLHAI